MCLDGARWARPATKCVAPWRCTRPRADSTVPATCPPTPPEWQSWSNDAILDLRMCELGLKIKDTQLQPRIDQLNRELHRAGIAFRPHVWFSDKWFTPDGVPGFAI